MGPIPTLGRGHGGRSRGVSWLALVLLVPFVVSACITVESDLLATPSPSAAAATPAASATPALALPSPTPTPRPTPEPVEAEVLGFVPYWLMEDAATTIDPSLLTIAAFHSVEAAQNGTLVSKKPNGEVPGGWAMLRSDGFTQLKERLQDAGVKVVPVIQRTAWTEGARARMVNLLTKPRNRRALAEAVAAFVSRRGFDGVNLDFEPLPASVAQEYAQLVREIRAALDEIDPELHLSVDVVPGLENYDLAALTAADAADLAVIMGYGYRTVDSKTTGPVAPLSDPATTDLATSVEAALEQVEPGSLLLALPWYGLAWSTQSDEAGARVRAGEDVADPAVATYGSALEQAARTGRRHEPELASAWSAYPSRPCSGCPSTWRQVWYDDPDTFGSKLAYALEQGLAGIGIWALGMEEGREELWWALRNQLRPRVDEEPPGGSPALDPEALAGEVEGRPAVSGSATLRLFAADESDGSGLAFVRIGLEPEVDGAGRLVSARTYPAVERVVFPLADPSTGGSAEEGPRSIHVQWRDLAGNWSVPVVVEAYVRDPARSATPAGN